MLLQEGSGVIKDKYVASENPHHLTGSSGFVAVVEQKACVRKVSCDSGRTVP